MHPQDRQRLLKLGLVGDLQYRPYASIGPILENTKARAVTLFELDELREFAAKRDKSVIVVGPPCALCGKTRTEAFRPLLLNPKLKLWTDLILDSQTAEELLPAPVPMSLPKLREIRLR